jgi:hypothetical protein
MIDRRDISKAISTVLSVLAVLHFFVCTCDASMKAYGDLTDKFTAVLPITQAPPDEPFVDTSVVGMKTYNHQNDPKKCEKLIVLRLWKIYGYYISVFIFSREMDFCWILGQEQKLRNTKKPKDILVCFLNQLVAQPWDKWTSTTR